MKKVITPTAAVASGVEEAWRDVGASFERLCLTAGIATLADMMERDAADLCGPRYGREDGRRGHRWGTGGRQARLPRRQDGDRTAPCARPRRPRAGVAELGGGPGRGLAGAMGHEPDADQRLDAPVRARRSAARGRYSSTPRRRRIEVAGVASVRGVVDGADARMDGGRPVQARSAGDPD